MIRQTITLSVNGATRDVAINAADRLVEVLNRDFGLVSVRDEAESGEVGSSTVLLDGLPVLAALTLACLIDGRAVTTAEGILAADGGPHPLAAAFRDHGVAGLAAAPGLLVASAALLAANPRPTVEDIRRGLAGNLSFESGYRHVIAAVEQAARHMVNAAEVRS